MSSGTPSQTAGPYVSIGTSWSTGSTSGVVVLKGCVRDGAGAFVTDALLEFWSAGSFGRALTGEDGCYEVRLGDVAQVDVSIFARGLMQRLVTRIYLSDEDGSDSLDPELRRRLLARPEASGDLVFDIHMQGEHQTVFFSPWPAPS